VIGPDERVDVMTALKAITIVPAWHYREEASKGSIEVGKLADLVILDRNPLTVPVDDIPGITVVETFKEGRTIYLAGQKERAEDRRLSPTRHASREARVFFADDGAAATGCACCEGTLADAWREAALKSMNEFAESPLLS
jgi:adenine deaminase